MKNMRWLGVTAAIAMAVTSSASFTEGITAYAEAGSNIDEAIGISVNKDVNDSLGENSYSHYYTFTTEKDGRVRLDFSHEYVDDPDDYWTITLKDFNEQTICTRSFSGSETDIASFPDIGLPAGKYYVVVSGASRKWSSVPYTLNVDLEVSDTWEKEFNNDYASASKMKVNTDYSGSIANDEDYYTFTTEKDGMVKLAFSHEYIDSPDFYWNVKLYNFDKDLICSRNFAGSDKGAVYFPEIGLAKGTYYVKVYGYSAGASTYRSSDVTYTLNANFTASDTWEKELNTDFASASEMKVNTDYKGSIANDEDYYTFTTDKDGMVKLAFSHEYIDSPDLYWNVKLYNFDKDLICSRNFAGSDKEAVYFPEIGLPAGTYYVKVYGYSAGASTYRSSDVTYTLNANFTASDTWEKELDNNYASASEIKVNTDYSGSIANDEDYYTFNTDKDGMVKLAFSHEYIDSPDLYWTVTLYNFDKQAICTRYFAGSDKEADYFPEIGLPAGTYYLKVYGYDITAYDYRSSDLTYTLNANFTASDTWEKEINDDFDSASKMDLDTDYNGSISNTKDLFSFTTEKDGMIELLFTHEYIDDPENYWTVKLYNFDKNLICAKYFTGSSEEGDGYPQIGLPAGTYYVEVYGYDITAYDYRSSDLTYTLNAQFTESDTWEKEFNNSYETATVLPLDTEMNGSVLYGDSDIFAFTLDGDDGVDIDFSHVPFDDNEDMWHIKLWNFEKELIDETYSKASEEGKVTLKMSEFAKGTYYVEICGTKKWYSEATYTISVNHPTAMQGDINGDGMITVTDLSKVAAHIKGLKMLDDESVADVNGDGVVNVTDLSKIAAHVKGIKLLE